jgi:hypothetical protein
VLKYKNNYRLSDMKRNGNLPELDNCLLDTMSDSMGKVKKKARNLWIMQEMISRMDEQSVNNEEGSKNYRRMNN